MTQSLTNPTTFQMRWIWRIVFVPMTLACLFACGLILYGLFDLAVEGKDISHLFLALFMLAALALFGYNLFYFLEITTERLKITPDGLSYRSVLKRRNIKLSDVLAVHSSFPFASGYVGFANNHVITILPKQNSQKGKIVISPYINDNKYLREWLNATQDLNLGIG